MSSLTTNQTKEYEYSIPTIKKRKLATYLQDYCDKQLKTDDQTQAYERFFNKATQILPFYGNFTERKDWRSNMDQITIPILASFFDEFDPINTPEEHPLLPYRDREVGPAAFEHLAIYLLSDDYNVHLLREQEHDSMVHAMIAFVLPWSLSSLQRFELAHPTCAKFIQAIIHETFDTNSAYVYQHRTYGYPFVKTSFKILRRAFPQVMPQIKVSTFSLLNLLPSKFINDLIRLYDILQGERYDYSVIRSIMEKPEAIPYDIQDEIGNYKDLKARSMLKFITGQACCGKTTLLNNMRRLGWKIVSRGSIGSFSGKANNPVAVACLHASIDWALQHDNVLGDRGHIDNPLWVGIMQFCNPIYRKTLILDILNFISDNFTATTIGFFIAQKGVVFVDPFPRKCSQRMLRRNNGGDAFRGRIATYAIVQTMAYYIVARLFGWKVYTVPYDINNNFDPSQYGRIGEELHAFFGPVGKSYPLPKERFSKAIGAMCFDQTYPKSIGIFK